MGVRTAGVGLEDVVAPSCPFGLVKIGWVVRRGRVFGGMKRQGILEGFRASTTRFSRATHRNPPAHDKMVLRSHRINPVPSLLFP